MQSHDPLQLSWLIANLPYLECRNSKVNNRLAGEIERLYWHREESRYYIISYTGYGYLQTLTGIQEITDSQLQEMKAADYWEFDDPFKKV